MEFFPIICISICLNYIGGILLGMFDADGKDNWRKITFYSTVVLNLLILGYWKYFNFLTEFLGHVLGIDFGFKKVLLPIGISFYTFQGISYIMDIYHRKVPVQRKIVNLGLYIALFPQLIAGPIVRYADIDRQLQKRGHSMELFAAGIRRFSAGLAKKAILANSLAVNADAVFAMPSIHNTPDIAWLGAVSYMLQIYFDFSGYSDMAIGLGKMFGFYILENFDYPYISKSIAEFWRRWHISLGNWLKDYVYIPLGGSRTRQWKICRNYAIVFLLTGIWHGADWTFVFWGIFHGACIIVSILMREPIGRFNRMHKFTRTVWFDAFRVLRTDFLVLIGFVFFKAVSMKEAVLYLKSMFGLLDTVQVGYGLRWYLTRYDIFILAVSLVAMVPLGKGMLRRLEGRVGRDSYVLITNVGSLILLGLSMMYVVTSTYNPFIYFQF